jgi:nitrite reductase/ring-hydroxylating ferredoxin subunit
MRVSGIDEESLEAARQELGGEASETEARPFLYACQISEIPSNGKRGKVVYIDNDEIALFNINGEIIAISNICPHETSPVMATGFVDCDTCRVACPLHGWIFDMHTGRQIGPSVGAGPGSIPTYRVKLEGEEVWVAVTER